MECLFLVNGGPINVSTVLIIIFVLTLIYWYVTKKQNHWHRLGVPGPTPWFLVGNLKRFRQPVSRFELDWTKKYGPIYGYYLGLKPVLTISDPKLIKQILVKDFNRFVNRQRVNTFHKIMSENLFLLEKERWKRVRTIVTPTFTSGKLRAMQQQMKRAADKLADYFDKLTENNESVATIVTKEVIFGFTIDVIASTTFAIEINTNDDDDDRSKKNPFLRNGLQMFEVNPLKMVAIQALPTWFNINVLGIEYFPPKGPVEFFINLTRTIVRQRKSATSNKKRTDLVQLLLDASVDENELKSTNLNKLSMVLGDQKFNDKELNGQTFKNKETPLAKIQKLSENEIIAQCIFFFVAGFETIGATISHCLFELAKNQNVQQRLCDELLAVLDLQDNNLPEYYDKLASQIPYLDATINETLRKYPPLLCLNRMLTTDRYQMTECLELKRNQLIEIPVYSIHHNPEFYPNPERFDPDRFMPENRHQIVPYTFLPFGGGPRNCVGIRFAFQEIKIMLARIIPFYRIVCTENTPDQLMFKTGSPILLANPFELGIAKRY